MGLFSRKPQTKSYLGIDVGQSGVKLVELKNEKGRARLVTYAYAQLPSQGYDSDNRCYLEKHSVGKESSL